MLIEEALEWLVDNGFIANLTIPSDYMNTFKDFLNTLGSLNFILPVDTLFECVLFTMSFALVCGLIKITIMR